MLSDFWLSFIPLFVAFDVFGVLPLYITITSRLDARKKRRNLRDSMLTAFFTALVFVILGSKIMEYLGITIEDFLIAGGIVYSVKKPDPFPESFGFHELFHTLMMIGAMILHFPISGAFLN